MKITSPLIHGFLEICRCRNLTMAARQLGLSQPALSLRLKNLEDLVEETLLIRQRDGIVLTEAGQRFLKFAETLEGLEQECLADLRQDNVLRGTLRLGCFATIGRSLVLPALADMMREHTQLQLNYSMKEIRELPGLLHTGELDIIFLDYPLSKEGVENTLLGHEKYVFITGADHPKVPEIYLNHDENDLMSFRYWESLGEPRETLNRRFLDEIYHVIDGVAEGLGVSVLPRHLIESDERIKIVHPRKVFESPVYMVTKKRAWRPKHMELALEKLHKNVKNGLLRHAK